MNNTDWFGIFLDTYLDGINGFGFIVTPANVQLKAKYSSFGEDENWDAVWESETQITSEGWVAEIRIPHSAVRFPNATEQVWHVNFGRLIQRLQQKSFWNPIDPEVNGFLNQAGYLMGIEDITSPVRLQATPFLAFYGEHHHDSEADPMSSMEHSINGGLDIKYGINDAFTLDMTLIPDFGEAQSDNQILNLSPFEVRFDENRQFFTEGTELFNKGNIFYSRRIGGQPLYRNEVEDQLEEGEEIIDNPNTTPLYNATKVSGRTRKGLGLGFFNATAGHTEAVIRNPESGERKIETNPLTNYNIFVADQNLPHNSYVSLINTTVWRSGDAYDANVTATEFELRDEANNYALFGRGNLSQKYYPDSRALGHAMNIRASKTSGNLTATIGYSEESDTYDPNDFGFQFNNNERSIFVRARYNFFEPHWVFNQGGFGAYVGYERLYRPDEFSEFGYEIWAWGQT